MPEYTVDWTTEVPTKPGLYWAYEAVDPYPLDAVVMLVDLDDDGVFWGVYPWHEVEFSKDYFSHFMRVEQPDPPITGS